MNKIKEQLKKWESKKHGKNWVKKKEPSIFIINKYNCKKKKKKEDTFDSDLARPIVVVEAFNLI